MLESLGTPVVVAAHTNGADEWAAKAAQRTRRGRGNDGRAQRFRSAPTVSSTCVRGTSSGWTPRGSAERWPAGHLSGVDRQLLKKPSSLEPKDKEALRR